MVEDMGDGTSHGSRGRGRSTLFPVVHRSERRGNNVTQEHEDNALWGGGGVEDVEAGIVSQAPVTTVGGSSIMEGGFRKRRSSSEPPSFAVEVSAKQLAGEITPSGLEQGSRGVTESAAGNPGAVSHSQPVCATAAASGASEGSVAIGENVIPQAAASVRKEKEMTVSSVFPLSSGLPPSVTDVCGGSERAGGKSAANVPKRRSTIMLPGTWTNRLARPGHLRRTSSKISEATESEFKTAEELARLESVREEL